MEEGYEVFKLGLNYLVGSLALLGNSIVANIAFAIDYECKGISG